jgi:glycosyltransferase involved in cell wall biosynthesis
MTQLVSILIPAYNAEKLLRETMLSAINQTWPNKEIIVVDDGSSDQTFNVAKSLESSTVKVITQPNRGASAARNTALRYAQGSYIQWLDADDLLAPDKLSQQLRDAKSGTTSRVLLSSTYGEFFVQPHRARFVPHTLWQDLEPINFLLAIFTQNLWMSPAVWVVSRKLTELAGPWDEQLTLDDDGEYFSRVVAASDNVRFVPEARSYYRRHNVGSLSRTVSGRACESLFLSLSLRISQLRHLEDSDRTRSASIQLLQTWLDYFYPEKDALLQQVNTLARDLGGTLSPPSLSWKYQPIKAVFGWKAAKQMRNIVSNTKLIAQVKRDQLSFMLSRK